MSVLKVNLGALDNWSRSHGDVGADVKGVADSAAGNPNLFAAHGTISQPLLGVQSNADAARNGALAGVHEESTAMAGRLSNARQMYDKGDAAGAERIRAADSRLQPSQGGAEGQGGGAQQAGQMVGQVSQMVGQAVQGITQPIQGIAQAIGQMPQQVMQSVQGMAQAAGQGGGATAAAASGAVGSPAAGQAGKPEGRDAKQYSGPLAAGGPENREKAPTQGIMSPERMRELQGLPPEEHGHQPNPDILY